MSDFETDSDNNWWLTVTGKGNKVREIPISKEMLDSLKLYRRSLKLPALPIPDDKTPLITTLGGKNPITSTRQVRLIVQNCFDAALIRMTADGMSDDARELKSSTVHWLRHTGLSEDVKVRPREHVRDDAGHESSVTTDRYIDSDKRERHLSAQKKRLRDL